MIATSATTDRPASSRATSLSFSVPDVVIRTYFALFPALVALFLTVQAVRAQIPDIGVVATSPATMTNVE